MRRPLAARRAGRGATRGGRLRAGQARTGAIRGATSGDEWTPRRHGRKEQIVSGCLAAHDPQLARLADAIAQRVGQQRFNVWFNNSTRLDLKHDGLEIAVPNDFISEWIGTHFTRPIQDAAHEVFGCPLHVRFNVVPQLFESKSADGALVPSVNGDAASASLASSRPIPGKALTSARIAPAPHFGRIDR